MKHISYLVLFLLFTNGFSSCSNNDFAEQEITFNNPIDGTQLSGTLTQPKSSDKTPAVILIHGSGPHNRNLRFFSGKQLFKDLAEHLTNNGIAVLRYDKRGVGKSKGQFIPFDMENFSSDGIAGIDYLKTVPGIDTTKIGAIGISQGGLVVPMMIKNCPGIKFAVLLGGPGTWGKEFIYSSQLAITKAAGFNDDEIKQMTAVFDSLWPLLIKDELQVDEEINGKEWLRKLWTYIDPESRNDFGFLDKNVDFWFDQYRGETIRRFYDYDPAGTIKSISCPVLAMTGDKDVQVPSKANLLAIETALKNGNCPDYKIIELENHNHIFQNCETGKISEYKKIEGTMSIESLTIIKDWILETISPE
jgi:dipeptidyl aminopeptidase/acylaminoacyl peptidase